MLFSFSVNSPHVKIEDKNNNWQNYRERIYFHIIFLIITSGSPRTEALLNSFFEKCCQTSQESGNSSKEINACNRAMNIQLVGADVRALNNFLNLIHKLGIVQVSPVVIWQKLFPAFITVGVLVLLEAQKIFVSLKAVLCNGVPHLF